MSEPSGEKEHLRDTAERAVRLLRKAARMSPFMLDVVDDVSRYIRAIEAENAALSGSQGGSVQRPDGESKHQAPSLTDLISEAIEEWSVTAFHPNAPRPNDPTLARYIAAKVQAHVQRQVPGSTAHHSIITPECRTNRGDVGAFDEAVDRARREYDGIVEGWRKWNVQPTLHLLLTLERPARSGSQGGSDATT